MNAHRVVVVGAGMGGLVAALQLAHQGLDVTVVEAAATPGGKLRQVMVDGQPIDSGPTVFTMRWVFDQLLASVGTRLENELRIQPLPVLARHWWAGDGQGEGSQLDLLADPAQAFDAVARFAGPDEARRFQAFCAEARRVYQALEAPYIQRASTGPLALTMNLGLRGLATLSALGPLRSLWHTLGRHFHDPRMRQLFARYATYTGSSPWQAPATLMLIAQVELDGVWSVDGGMHALARCLERLARERGATFRYQSPCEQIELRRGRVAAVRLTSGETLTADSVVFNGDAAALRAGLLGKGPRRAVQRKAPPRSLSAITWSINAPTSGLALDRHNVFFQRNYANEFDDIFRAGRLPRQPTVYVCAQDRGIPDVPTGAERLLCLVNAPAAGDCDSISPEAIEQCENNTWALLRRCGLNMQPTQRQVVRTTPTDFHHLFPATGGALYGQASHGWTSAFARSGARTPVPGLYLAGGSVHPGPGVPMAALSGLRAVEAVMANPALTRWCPPVATSGGTSTP
ncbi:1-hydroxycarotenoid 3,4-desaturase CrtD [Hydrogenophaga sp.]|uniref:1-hydroxycarotenoid 3,4-desaturase CrtD n=1 Tax=Hydrogenophaga sp. TaxID=1904254 RepID=UPI00272460B8|nr:1-hydroxycarotenoid 3,4-desaturase CrtD [Hydrogenophaga sp.]MDO8906729.1 phytoene desaturase family protein [Hydrogenophaga sp.]